MQWFSIILRKFVWHVKPFMIQPQTATPSSYSLTLSVPLMPVSSCNILNILLVLMSHTIPFVFHTTFLFLHLLDSSFKIQFQDHFISPRSPSGLPWWLEFLCSPIALWVHSSHRFFFFLIAILSMSHFSACMISWKSLRNRNHALLGF